MTRWNLAVLGTPTCPLSILQYSQGIFILSTSPPTLGEVVQIEAIPNDLDQNTPFNHSGNLLYPCPLINQHVCTGTSI